jgi:thymidylate kinase
MTHNAPDGAISYQPDITLLLKITIDIKRERASSKRQYGVGNSRI